jgi:adenylylsulfate kinase-like enzyme
VPVIWITGLPGVGKSSVARELVARLRAAGDTTLLLDGDALRDALSPLAGGYDVPARRRLAQAYANLAALASAQGLTVVVATVSLIADVHRENRVRFTRYLEVLLSCADAERERRRASGALAGPRHMIEIAPEFPADPHLSLATDAVSPDALAERILERWHADGR